ncbi:MAG TPA: tetratricopeptide repeat protein [Terriglobales bacterium]|nr:tetratricopeptide repeat protein [Terriglobales bacterium]
MSHRYPRTDGFDCFWLSIAIAPIILLLASFVQAQSQTSAVEGTVLDRSRHPISGAAVDLEVRGAQTLAAGCDSRGAYRFSDLGAGSYTVRVSMAGFEPKVFGPFALEENESKRIDFILEEAGAPAAKAQPSAPEFFDQPQFTVAGVREASNSGGHGSDNILRTTEGLVKATLALGEPKEGTSSSSPGRTTLSIEAATEKSLRSAAEHHPEDFEANARLGKWLLDHKEPQDAVHYLEYAFERNPEDDETGYELALAYAQAGHYDRARTHTEALLTHRPQDAKLYEVLADVEERLGEPLQAVRSYQRAAELNPSEINVFAWGAELLLHRAAEPAIEVFSRGHRSYPGSLRMLIGLGVAFYSRGLLEEANQRLCQASDVNPEDPIPYLFLGKIQAVEINPSARLEEKLKRFVRLQPNNALANYYYALGLWKGRTGPGDVKEAAQAELFFEKAVELDPTLGPAYLQLGILYAERRDVDRATSAYQKAIAATPRLEEAHYRLAQLYRLRGETEKAREELRAFAEIKKDNAQEVERERAEILQFVYTLRDPNSALQPQ